MLRLRVFVTHPVQYHVPLWRLLAAQPELDVKVFYFSDHGVRSGLDAGFGREIKWDVDLLSGYEHEFLARGSLEDRRAMRIPSVVQLLRRERPDWVLISGYTHPFERQLVTVAPALGAQVALRAEFSDLSVVPRAAWKSLLRSAFLRLFYRRISAFCYPGQSALLHLRAHGAAASRQFFSPYSVDDQLIVQAKARLTREQARAQLGIAPDVFMLLLSGKLIPRKDPLAVLAAIRSLPAHAKLGLIALGDGELRARFEPEARALLGSRFVFPGFVNQSELGRYFLAADALVMPSRQETWGLVVNEAMHYGLPVIVSDQTGCHTDLVVPGETGFVYPTGSREALARSIERLSADPATARRMGENSLAHVARYSIAASAQGVLQALGVDSTQQRAEFPAESAARSA